MMGLSNFDSLAQLQELTHQAFHPRRDHIVLDSTEEIMLIREGSIRFINHRKRHKTTWNIFMEWDNQIWCPSKLELVYLVRVDNKSIANIRALIQVQSWIETFMINWMSHICKTRCNPQNTKRWFITNAKVIRPSNLQREAIMSLSKISCLTACTCHQRVYLVKKRYENQQLPEAMVLEVSIQANREGVIIIKMSKLRATTHSLLQLIRKTNSSVTNRNTAKIWKISNFFKTKQWFANSSILN